MESCKHKSSLLMLLFSLVVRWIQAEIHINIEDERKALLDIKASLHESPNFFNVDNLLPTWVDDHGSTGGEYCAWERVTCDPTFGHVTDLSLSNIFSLEDETYSNYWNYRRAGMIWPLNVSMLLHFKELRRLDLSWSYISDTFMSTGLERFPGWKKLEYLNLSNNYIETNIFPLLRELTSLKILDLSYINEFDQKDSPTNGTHISEFQVLENLEVLDLSSCGYHGTIQMQAGSVSPLNNLKVLNLRRNYFNESLVTSLSALTSLKALDLRDNYLSGSFPSQELSHLTKLEKLDLTNNNLDVTPSIQGCKSLIRLKRLESVSLGHNYFNKSIMSCLSFLPSLSILDLNFNQPFGSSLQMQELSSLKELTTLDLSYCGLESLTINGTMSNLLHLNLDNNLFSSVDDVMRSIAAFPSLRFLSLEYSFIEGGRPFANEVPNLPDLEVLNLSNNNFNGTLPIEALASYHHLEVLDLGLNEFVGSIPPTIKLLSSLKDVSFYHNNLNGSLSNNGLCELKNLQEIDISFNRFTGNLPECFNRLSSLKLFDIYSNQFTGILPSSLISNLVSLRYVDFGRNKFEGSFSFSLFSNHTNLEFVSFISDNDKFEIETEEPAGWTPMFQLKVLVLPNCNINRRKGSIVPNFLLHQHMLKELDMSHNSLEGQFPNWLIKNNTMLEVVHLNDNSFGNIFWKPFYRNLNIRFLDMSGNHMIGAIPNDIHKFLPYITTLNLSRNSIVGVIPSSIGDLGELQVIDLSHNELSGEVPTGLFTNLSHLQVLKLSNNSLHGEVLSGDLIWSNEGRLHLDNNYFTGKFINMSTLSKLSLLDISNNFFTDMVPDKISNITTSSEVADSLFFLDISQNNFSGSIPYCLNLQRLNHLHLGSNRFTGSIPGFFSNMTKLLTLDIGDNYLSGRIPNFLGELSTLRILILGENNFSGSIPRQLCWLTNVSLIDISNNFLSGSIPCCFQNITGPSYQAFTQTGYFYGNVYDDSLSSYNYLGDLVPGGAYAQKTFKIQDQVLFTTKSNSLTYKGNALDTMYGLDLSCNRLVGDIPAELGFLTQMRVLNLSHNRLTGPIPVKFSNLSNIESLDLSSNELTGEVPSELIKLNSLAVFNVSFNNLSGRLPEMKAQFSTFTKESYKGNPLLCGPPLEVKCTVESQGTNLSNEEGSEEKWHDIDMVSLCGSFVSTWFVFILGAAALLYVNPNWRRRWFDLVEECMYTCYYFFYDLVSKAFMLFSRTI